MKSGLQVADTVYDVMKSRRAIRAYTDEPVADDQLRRIVAAARWASNASNRHIHKFLITRDPAKMALVRAFSPGLLAEPPAMIVILTDQDAVRREKLQEGDNANDIDVGTSAQNMMNMAQALGLGTCPVTSFSKAGVGGVLGLPASLNPELILLVGHPRPVERQLRPNAPKPVSIEELTYWEEVGGSAPA